MPGKLFERHCILCNCLRRVIDNIPLRNSTDEEYILSWLESTGRSRPMWCGISIIEICRQFNKLKQYLFCLSTSNFLGGENVIQCTRENELHHLWSQTIDCLVCICLNEYGLLQPVCASCSGCRKPAPPEPPPNMPEPIPPTIDSYSPLPVPDPFAPRPVPNFEPFTPSASAPSLVAEPEMDLELTTPGPVPDGM